METVNSVCDISFAERSRIFSHDYLKYCRYILSAESPQDILSQKFYWALVHSSQILEDFLATERPTGSSLTTLAYPETWFGANFFQIISKGPNRTTLAAPFRGLEPDDITNFGY